MVGLGVTLLLAAALSGSYDCTIEHQGTVTESGVEASAQVMFPESDRDQWRFSVQVSDGRTPNVTIDWPANPIQIAGRHPAVALAPGQVAFAAVAGGPCMFTEDACLALVELSARDEGSAAFSILPAGSSRSESGARSLLNIVFVGTCRPHASSRTGS
jgi:hypothetical protein